MSSRHKIQRPSRPLPQTRARGALGIPEDSELVPVMKWMLASTCSFLREAGYSQEQLREELLQLQRDPFPTPSLTRSVERRGLKISAVQRLLVEWCGDRRYMHPDSGDPRSLRMKGGEGSLASLLTRHFPRLSTERALACLEEQGAIVRQADGRYFPMRGYPSHVHLEVVAQRSSRYLKTALRNLRARDSAESYPEQASVTARLPMRCLEEFLQQSRQQLQTAVDTIQTGLMDRHAEDSQEPCVTVSIHGYVSVEHEEPVRQRASASRAKARTSPRVSRVPPRRLGP